MRGASFCTTEVSDLVPLIDDPVNDLRSVASSGVQPNTQQKVDIRVIAWWLRKLQAFLWSAASVRCALVNRRKTLFQSGQVSLVKTGFEHWSLTMILVLQVAIAALQNAGTACQREVCAIGDRGM